MNREILFRGKRKDNKQWVESSTIVDLGKNHALYMANKVTCKKVACEVEHDLQYNIIKIAGQLKYPMLVLIDAETVGRYTG